MKAINVIKKLRLKPVIPQNWVLSPDKFLKQHIPAKPPQASPQTPNQLLIRRIPASETLQSLGITIHHNAKIDQALMELDQVYEKSDDKLELAYQLLEVAKVGSELNDSIIQKIISILGQESISHESKVNLFKAFIIKVNKVNISLFNKTMETLYETWIRFAQEEEILATLNSHCSSPVTRGLLIHYFILLGKYDLALAGFETNVKLDLFLCELLGFHLLAQKESHKFLELLIILNRERYPYSINQQLLYIWLDRCLESKDTLSINQFIELCGTADPLILYDHEHLSKISQLTLSSGFTGQYQQIMRYVIAKMKYDHCFKKDVNEVKKKSKVNVVENLVTRYGASRILENRLFKATGLLKTSNLSINDFKLFIDSLASEIRGKKLTLADAAILIEKIHGYHVNDDTYRYAATLHPDEHISRMFKAKHANSTSSIDDLKQAGIIKSPKTAVGKPLKTSKKYLAKKINADEAFSVIPLNIVLSVINQNSNDLLLSIKLIRLQIKKRKVKINNETVQILLNMFEKNPAVQVELLRVAYFFGDYVDLQDKELKHVFEISSKVNNIDQLYEFLDFCRKKRYLVSDELYCMIEKTFKEKGDDRYIEFKPLS